MSRKFNAILGLGALAAFGFASSAFAQCPTSPLPTWSGVTQTQGAVAIAAGGLAGTSCRMESSLNVGASGFAAATVRDDTPGDEPRYRAQFVINADNITGLGTFSASQVFTASSTNPHPAVGGFTPVIRISISGAAGGQKNINFVTANEGVPANLSSASAPLQSGENVIEIDWQVGATGSLTYWVNSASEGSPTGQLSNLNNAGWVGITNATLGLSGANTLFRTNHAGQIVQLDEFDSRRQSFIGN